MNVHTGKTEQPPPGKTDSSLFVTAIHDDEPLRRLVAVCASDLGDAYRRDRAHTVRQTLSAGQQISPRFNRRGIEYLMVLEGELILNGKVLGPGTIVRLDPGEIATAQTDVGSIVMSHIFPYTHGLVHQGFVLTPAAKSGPLVSIVIIAKDVERYVAQCISSCMRQTYPNVEVVVVEDASADDTLKKCLSMATFDARVHIYTHGGGRNSARRHGLSKASGDYIVIIDGDDWLNEDAVDILVNTAASRDSDCLIYGFDYYDDRTGEVWGPAYPSGAPLKTIALYTNRGDESALVCSTHNHTIWMYAFSRALAGRAHDALVDIQLYEDLPFYLLMIGQSKNPVLCNHVLYHYRRNRAGQATSKWNEVKPGLKLSCLQASLDSARKLRLVDDAFMKTIMLYKVGRIVEHEVHVANDNGDPQAASAWTAFWQDFVRDLGPEIAQHVIEPATRSQIAEVFSSPIAPPLVLPSL